MDLFKSPTWDVDNASNTLNRALFGSGKKRKVNLEIKQTSRKNKSSPHLTPFSSENVNSNQEAFISKVKGKFSKKKIVLEDVVQDSLSSDSKSVKKKKKKGANQAANVLQSSFNSHKIADKTEMTLSSPTGKQNEVCGTTSELNALVRKTKKSRGKLNKLPGLAALKNLKSKRKRTFELPVPANGVNEAVENYQPLKSSKRPSTSPRPNNDESVVTESGKRKRKKRDRNTEESLSNTADGKRKRKKRDRNTEESLSNTAAQSSQNKDDGTVEGDIVGSSNQTKKIKQNKQKLKSTNSQPQTTNRIDIDQKDLKVLSRRQPGTLRERMMRRLQSSRFRYLNEQMYCSKGEEAFNYFKTDPQAFQAYHHGYRQQVAKWPLNPLTTIISALKNKSSELVIADFGCGDATLARSLPNVVHSFDLVAVSDEVTVCDMARTPLKSSSADVAVFCLSLMGTNLTDYLLEANRILRTGGSMKIAEVESRFENVDDFIKTLMKYGFKIVRKDLTHNLFYFMDFQKVNDIKKGKKSTCPPVTLKPCLYKKR